MPFQLHDIHLLFSPYNLKPGRMGWVLITTGNGSQNLKDCFIKCAKVYSMISERDDCNIV